MDYHHRDPHSSVSLLTDYLVTIPSSFKYPPTVTPIHQLNNGRAAGFARPAARATLLAGLLALLWIASPQAWSQTVTWTFTTGNEVNSSPAIGVDGTIYVGSRDHRLYAIDRDGTKKWEFVTGDWVDSSPAIGTGGTIYVGSLDAKVYAINSDGTKKWDYAADFGFYSSPAVGPDGTIYIASSKGRVYVFTPDGR